MTDLAATIRLSPNLSGPVPSNKRDKDLIPTVSQDDDTDSVATVPSELCSDSDSDGETDTEPSDDISLSSDEP